MLRELLERWPAYRQLAQGGDGTGREAMSERTRTLTTKFRDCEQARSVCPYCGVGCGQVIYHKN